MTSEPSELSRLEAPLGQLERALIEEYVRARGYDPRDLTALSEAERDALLKEASVHASAKLTEVESRSHYVHAMHEVGGPKTGLE